jgi:hypothetical protein
MARLKGWVEGYADAYALTLCGLPTHVGGEAGDASGILH